MTSLHAYFYNRDQAAFQRHLSTAPPTDVNARDWLGRTVLHLACASSTRDATEYVRMLLVHPAIDVNLQDEESHWTALHRALYNGNIAAAYVAHRAISCNHTNLIPCPASFCSRELTSIRP
jgi:ankyrin repeat protein